MARILSSRKGYHPMLCDDEGPVPQQDRGSPSEGSMLHACLPRMPTVGCLGAVEMAAMVLNLGRSRSIATSVSVVPRIGSGGTLPELDVLGKRIASDLPRQTRRPPCQGQQSFIHPMILFSKMSSVILQGQGGGQRREGPAAAS